MAIEQGKPGAWIKSSYSGGNGACVEVMSPVRDALAVRDSKVAAGPHLGFPAATWSAFVSAVDDSSLPCPPGR